MNPGPESRTWAKGFFRENSIAETTGTSLLLSLLFMAAISETMNNVLIVLLFVWWLATRPVARELREAPPHLLIIVLFCTTPLISLATSTVGEPFDRLVDVTGAIKFALLLLPVWSISLRHRVSVDPVTACLIAGTLIALIEAFTTWRISSDPYPILKALVGVNGSALYMSVVLVSAIALSWSPKLPLSILGYAVIVISFWYSIIMNSVTAFIVSVCILLLASVISMLTERWKVFLPVIAGLAILSGAAASATTSGAQSYWRIFTRDTTERFYGDEIYSYRFEIFNTAAEVYDRNSWFGAGYRQFGKATSVEIVTEELEREGRSYEDERSRFYHVNHGHNVWTQVLVERGLVGVALLLAFFLATAFRISRNVLDLYRKGERGPESVRPAFISAGAWTMLFIGGIGNSTFHTEHGMAALLLLVWSLARFEITEE